MTYDELEVGRVYYCKYASDGEPCLFELRGYPQHSFRAGEKYWRDFGGANLRLDQLTDIAPVPSREEWEAMQSAIAKKDAAIERILRERNPDAWDQVSAALETA